MRGPYPGELRIRVIHFVEEEYRDVRRPNKHPFATTTATSPPAG
jgi:hypothetical protein